MKPKIDLPPGVVQVMRRSNPKDCGLGFIAAGGYVVTAAHNLELPKSATGLYEDDSLLVAIRAGEHLAMTPVFADRCADLAVLSIDEEEVRFGHDGDALDEIPPLLVAWTLEIGEHRGSIVTHDRGREEAICSFGAGSGCIKVTSKDPINGGTSGGPVCDRSGKVLAVVSQTTSAFEGRVGWGPAIAECLPPWLAKRILRYEKLLDGTLNTTEPVGTTRNRKKPRSKGR